MLLDEVKDTDKNGYASINWRYRHIISHVNPLLVLQKSRSEGFDIFARFSRREREKDPILDLKVVRAVKGNQIC